jgi:pre-mRNA-processing factor 17
LSEDQKEIMQRYEEMRKQRLEEHKQKDKEEAQGGEEVHKSTTVAHGTEKFVEPPGYLRPKEHACFLPKKWLHTWVGHNKGVQRIEFFPKLGHLLLSASHDSTIKIWDVLSHKRCLRTYMGHSKAVRDICFSNDGRRFLSAGFDKVIQLWDTETGKVIRSFSNNKTPFCVKFHPSDDKQNIFLAGCANKKIL